MNSACSISERENNDLQINWIAVDGGSFTFGDDNGAESEKPEIEMSVESFYMSRTEVTNAMFKTFVDETGYISDAEKGNKGGIVFKGNWEVDSTATWQHPSGKTSSIDTLMNHPVVQVTYDDALAYCQWAGVRLPSELEFEYAMKKVVGKQTDKNIWTGVFPVHNNARDGYQFTAPVDAYDVGKTDFAHLEGNVWEWCLDSYHMEIHDKQSILKNVEPYLGVSFDPFKEDTAGLRVIKGGSFMCHNSYCAGYRPAARQSAEQTEAYFHVGFRVAKYYK